VLTRHIEQLEYFMGAALIERSPRGVRLTAAGELLAAKLDRTISELDHVGRLIEDLKGMRTGSVSVYAGEGIAAAVLLPAVTAFAEQFPGVRFDIRIGSARQAVRALDDASCDLALTFFAPESDRVAVVKRVWLPQLVIVAPHHPAAGLVNADLPSLAGYDWALPSGEYGVRGAITRAATAAGVSIVPKFQVASLEVQKQLIRHAGAIGLLPRVAALEEINAGTLIAVPLVDSTQVSTSVDLCVGRDRQPTFAAERFRRTLEQVLDRMLQK
jgi:DNA-binding transcriptional LysR family regulator